MTQFDGFWDFYGFSHIGMGTAMYSPQSMSNKYNLV